MSQIKKYVPSSSYKKTEPAFFFIFASHQDFLNSTEVSLESSLDLIHDYSRICGTENKGNALVGTQYYAVAKILHSWGFAGFLTAKEFEFRFAIGATDWCLGFKM